MFLDSKAYLKRDFKMGITYKKRKKYCLKLTKCTKRLFIDLKEIERYDIISIRKQFRKIFSL